MHIKPRLLLFILIVADIAFAIIALTFKLLSLIVTLSVFACFLVLVVVAYNRLYNRISQKVQNKVLQSLQLNYSEITPIHPLLMAIHCHIPYDKNIKVYSKVCYGYNIHIKFVSTKETHAVITTDYLWYYTSFKRKESN